MMTTSWPTYQHLHIYGTSVIHHFKYITRTDSQLLDTEHLLELMAWIWKTCCTPVLISPRLQGRGSTSSTGSCSLNTCQAPLPAGPFSRTCRPPPVWSKQLLDPCQTLGRSPGCGGAGGALSCAAWPGSWDVVWQWSDHKPVMGGNVCVRVNSFKFYAFNLWITRKNKKNQHMMV